MVRDSGEDSSLIVRIWHSFGDAAPVELPLAFLIEFRLAFHAIPCQERKSRGFRSHLRS